MKRIAGLLLLTMLLAPALGSQASEPELKPLFDGATFDGWTEPENNIWWKAQDGVLSLRSGPEKKGSILWTRKKYASFVMQLDFRFGEGTVDSGVFVRAEREQIQIGISGSLRRDMTCSPYISGKGYPVEAEGVKELLKSDDWNTVRIEARGPEYTTWLNGVKVMTYTSDTAIKEGPIGLQLHPGRDMAIDFRNISLAELPADTPN